MMLRGIPSAADFADCARLGMADANNELEGVAGLSSSLAMPLLLFLGSPNGPSSSIGRSGRPDSAPSKVRNSRSRSCLKCFSFCSMRLSSMYSASSSASSLGVRFSRLERYFFRMTSRSVEYVSRENLWHYDAPLPKWKFDKSCDLLASSPVLFLISLRHTL